MDVGIRIEGLRKVFTSPPPAAAMARGGPMGGQRLFKRPEKKKAYEVVALDGVSLEVKAGEIFGLLGPNGAGKSTTVGILTTRVRPTAGEAWIGGHEVWRERVAVKRLIGVVPAEAEPRLRPDGARDPHLPRGVLRDSRGRAPGARGRACSIASGWATAPTRWCTASRAA